MINVKDVLENIQEEVKSKDADYRRLIIACVHQLIIATNHEIESLEKRIRDSERGL